MDWRRIRLESRAARYASAVGLAVAAQFATFPFVEAASLPLIIYAPFVVMSALMAGVGPGLVTTALCALEAAYFVLDSTHSFALADRRDWDRIAALVLTGLIASVLSEGLRRFAARLNEANHRTGRLLENLSDGFNAFDREWRYTYVNEAGARLVGKTREELLGKNLWELWPEAAESPFGRAYRRAVEENVSIQVEAFYAPLNAWFDARGYPSPDGLSVLFSDTTARRQAQEQLRLLESAALQTTDGIVIVKVSGEECCCQEPVFANPAFCLITGFTLAELRDGALARLYEGGANPHTKASRPLGFRKSCPNDVERRVRRKDGSEFWGEWGFKRLADKDGAYTHCVWTCRDITQRKNAEEESRMLAAIVESSDDAIIGKNLDGVVLSWNQGAQQIY